MKRDWLFLFGGVLSLSAGLFLAVMFWSTKTALYEGTVHFNSIRAKRIEVVSEDGKYSATLTGWHNGVGLFVGDEHGDYCVNIVSQHDYAYIGFHQRNSVYGHPLAIQVDGDKILIQVKTKDGWRHLTLDELVGDAK